MRNSKKLEIILAHTTNRVILRLFQPAYTPFQVIGIFICTVICIADQETASAPFVIFNHQAVALGLSQYPVPDLLTFILYLRTYYILVAVRFKSPLLYATPIVASSFILPPIFSTTITQILPERCLFFLINIVKRPFAASKIR